MSVSANYLDNYKSDKLYDVSNDKKLRIGYEYSPITCVGGGQSGIDNKTLVYEYKVESKPVLFSQSYLEICYEIRRNDGSRDGEDIDPDDIVMVINNAWSKFQRMTFKINGREVNSIDYNWLVQHVANYGLVTNRYAESVLADDMDYVPDKGERICREFYPGSMISNPLDFSNDEGIQQFGLFEEGYFSELAAFSSPNAVLTPINNIGAPVVQLHLVRLVIDNHVDIGKIVSFYDNWHIIFNSGVNEEYQNRSFKIYNTDLGNDGKLYVEISLIKNEDDELIHPVKKDAAKLLVLLAPVAANPGAQPPTPAIPARYNFAADATKISFTLVRPYDQKHPNYYSPAAKRSLKYHNSKPNVKRLPLALSHLIPVNMLDRVIGGFTWSIELDFEDDPVTLFHNQPGVLFHHKITRRVEPTLMVAVAKFNSHQSTVYKEMMMKERLVLNCNRFYYDTISERSSSTVSHKLVSLQKSINRPLQVFVCFHNNSNLIGGGTKLKSQLYNSLIFDNCGVTELRMRVTHNPYPAESTVNKYNFIKPTTIAQDPVKFNWLWKSFLDTYDKGLDFESDGCAGLTKNDFAECPIFSFDLESQNKDPSFTNNEGTIEIYVEGKLANPIDYQMFVITVVQQQIVLNYANQIASFNP